MHTFSNSLLENVKLHPLFESHQTEQVCSRIQIRSLEYLKLLFEDYVNACELLFQELAGRAESEDERRRYQQVLTLFGTEKSVALFNFEIRIQRQFGQLLRLAHQGCSAGEFIAKAAGPTLDATSVTLVANELVERYRQVISPKGMMFVRQLSHLLGFNEPADSINPLRSDALSVHFVQTFVAPLNSDPRTETILIKLFEKHVLTQLDPLFQQLSHMMFQVGVTDLPERDVLDQAGLADSLPTPALADRLRSLEQKSKAPVVGDLSNQRLLKDLVEKYSPSVGELAANDGLKNQVVPIVKRLMTLHQSAGPSFLSANDDLTVQLVSLLFDFLLDDENISLPIRHQLMRLQLPVLKAALKSREVFENSAHSVPRLFNLLGRIGLGYDNQAYSEDLFYKKVEYVVNGVINAKGDINKTFADAVIKLRHIVRLDEKSSHRPGVISDLNKNVINTDDLELEAALLAVDKEIVDRLEGVAIPEQVFSFFINQWRKVLLEIYFKNGTESYLWEDLLQVLDDMVWICKPHTDRKSLKRVISLKKEIINRLSAGLSMTFENRADYQRSLKQIFDVLIMAENGYLVSLSMIQPNRELLLRKLAGLHNPSPLVSGGGLQVSSPDIKSIHMAESLSVGSWLLYKDSDSVVRCCLESKRIHDGGFIFVDRTGKKVLQKNVNVFAADMEHGRARLLDQRPLFARALESIDRHLKHSVN